MSTPHLDRLLFIQGGLCFFCKQPLPRAEASIEHLVASANGGTNSEENCVACCRTLNSILGSKSIKEKIQVVLNQHGDFSCPKNRETVAPVSDTPASPAPVTGTSKGNGSSTNSAPKPSLPLPATTTKTRDTHQERLALVVADLRKRGNSRPRKEATLVSTIHALIKQRTNQPISEANLKKLISEMQQSGRLAIADGKVTYKL